MIYNSDNIKWMDFVFFDDGLQKLLGTWFLVRKSNNESRIERFLIHI